MYQHISHASHFFPGKVRILHAKLSRQLFRGFPDDFKAADNSLTQQFIPGKVIFRFAADYLKDEDACSMWRKKSSSEGDIFHFLLYVFSGKLI